jgi:hypothetical protein
MIRLVSALILKHKTNHNKGIKAVIFWAKPTRSLF